MTGRTALIAHVSLYGFKEPVADLSQRFDLTKDEVRAVLEAEGLALPVLDEATQ